MKVSEVLLASSLIENKHISTVGFNKAMRHSNPSHPLSGNASTKPLEKEEGVGDFSDPLGMSLIAISFSLIHLKMQFPDARNIYNTADHIKC